MQGPYGQPYGPPAGGYGQPQTPSPYGYGYGYASPTAYGPAAASTDGAPSLRWWILGSFVGMISTLALGGAISESTTDETGETIGGLVMVIALPLFFSYVVTALVWIYKSWQMLPDSMRYTDSGMHVNPGQAVGCLFIPFYNLYWYFVCSVGLCSALNRALAGLGSTRRASTGLAITAAVLQVIPYVNIVFAPIGWLIYMFNVEGAKREYARLSGRG